MAEHWHPTADLSGIRLRAELLRRARDYFTATGALEVETPVLVRAAVTDVHLESFEVRRSDGTRAGFLHTSPEYAMKRLLCAGAPDLYQIAHVFRDGERGRLHNPEFTIIEWYRLGADHHALMSDVERLVLALLAGRVSPQPSRRVSYAQTFREALGIDPLGCPTAEIAATIAARAVEVPSGLGADRDALLDLAMSALVAPAFPTDRLTFLHDFPASQAALARIDGPVAARFEAFWGAIELANGFHELGDAREQAQRFAADAAARASRGLPARDVDEDFLAALRAGLPPCAGVALGFDRVVMIAAGAARIDEVICFPVERA
jgi:lysyl-tRNA synthetase class 2